MVTDFSKPLGDIRREQAVRFEKAEAQYRQQRATAAFLEECPPRRTCIVCAAPLSGVEFAHRDVPFVRCGRCEHIQSAAEPPPTYPIETPGGIDFSTIYPRLSAAEYEDRKRRVYRPKLDWAVRRLEDLGYPLSRLRAARWVEIGCGAGYFVSCLDDLGVEGAVGLDADERLVEAAREHVPRQRFAVHARPPADALEAYPADVYVAFFVLEHLPDAHAFFEALRTLPSGTVFLFSVPVFGFSCLLENVFDRFYARNLDAVVHTQLYTDASIAYAMETADFEIAAQWVFGQDAEDFGRFMRQALAGVLPEPLLEEASGVLASIEEPFQQMLDRTMAADQRHVVAVKN